VPSVLITGGHSGIGLAASRELVAKGAEIVLAGRSPERMGEVADELRSRGGSVSTLALDMSSLSSVREAAAQLKSMLAEGTIAPLEAILCNAGGRFDGDVSYSPDGYETTFATNCLGNFLLVELLVPQLVDEGRIVFTASGTHDPDTPDGRYIGGVAEPDALTLAATGKDGSKPLSASKRYATSKLCTVMYAYELDRRLRRSGSSIASIAFDPGAIPDTAFLRGMPRPVQVLAASSPMKWLQKRMGITMSTADFSGASLAELAVDPRFADASGKYFQAKEGTLTAVPSAKLSYDEQRAAKLWEDSRRLVHLSTEEEAPVLR
jgi:NAD(P)-dependent dehydrogenase (short-subunit alcohol dehydrogenase family)